MSDSESRPLQGTETAPPDDEANAQPADEGQRPGEGEDATLGGYFEVHDRPPAFEGPDGHPYTVSPEVEKTGDLAAPYQGYLVFPKWAETGVGIVGHVESPTLFRERSTQEATDALGALSLLDVQRILNRAVAAAEPDPIPSPTD